MKFKNKIVERVTVDAVITRADGTVENLGQVFEYIPLTFRNFMNSPRYFLKRWYKKLIGVFNT